MTEAKHRLFAYGTLLQPPVQIAVFGRVITGTADGLAGFVRDTILIGDEIGAATAAYPILRRTRDAAASIPGMVFLVDDADLMAADHYEGSSYARILVRLESGGSAFVYVAPDPG